MINHLIFQRKNVNGWDWLAGKIFNGSTGISVQTVNLTAAADCNSVNRAGRKICAKQEVFWPVQNFLAVYLYDIIV